MQAEQRCAFSQCFVFWFLLQSDDKLQEFKQIAASLQQQPVKAALTGSSQRSSSRELVLPAKREIGDCYIWGSWSDAEVGLSAGAGAAAVAGAECNAYAAAGVKCSAYAGAGAICKRIGIAGAKCWDILPNRPCHWLQLSES